MKKVVIMVIVMVMAVLTAGCTTVYLHPTNESEEPYVVHSSSCWWGEAKGTYTVSTEYGVLCTGNGYSDKSKAISNPLEIRSNDDITVTLSDDSNPSTVTMTAGDTELISCRSSGSLSGYLYVIVNSSSQTEIETEDEPQSPKVSKGSSCWWGEARGKYTVSAEGYGAICSGNGYGDKNKAIENPLEIQSNGYDITVTLSSWEDTENITMVSGDTKLISCHYGSFLGYIYVVVY